MTPSEKLLPTRSEIKRRAQTLRAKRQEAGHPITQAQALERLSRRLGFRDWNTMSAALDATHKASCLAQQDGPKNLTKATRGDTVSGHYLGHPFNARVLRMACSAGGDTQLVLRLDHPIDAAGAIGVSAERQQIRCRVDRNGRSDAHLSDGTPHVALAL